MTPNPDITNPHITTPGALATLRQRWEAEKAALEKKAEYWRGRARQAEAERDHLLEKLRDR